MLIDAQEGELVDKSKACQKNIPKISTNHKNKETMNKVDSLKKIEVIDEKIAKLKAESLRMKNRFAQKKRKDDTRRKILIGALMMD